MNQPKTMLTELNIEEMCVFAESVLDALHMNYIDYDDEGNQIFDKYYDRGKNYDEIRQFIRKGRSN